MEFMPKVKPQFNQLNKDLVAHPDVFYAQATVYVQNVTKAKF